MATAGQSFYELYRRSSIGMALTDTLDDLISERRIEPQLAMKILANFDRSITEVLADKVKARLSFKGHLDTYRFCDEVWTFLIKDVTFKMENSSQTIQADKVKIATSSTPKSPAAPPHINSANDSTPTHQTTKMHPAPATPLLDPGSAKDLESASLHASHSKAYSSTNLRERRIEEGDMENKPSRKTQWIVLAVASGGCAAFNGVFAKLTTTELTTTWGTAIANLLGLGEGEKIVEYIIRALFFALNLIFNGIMWTLFTKALARGTSTTQVSIINTSSNFMLTALLGFIIFSESLPPLWWLGAAMLVAGNVIIGRREEEDLDANKNLRGNEEGRGEEGEGLMAAEAVGLELDEDLDAREAERKRREAEDVLQLDLDGQEGKRSDELI
ncbi:hypothetical protein B7494_g4120 [Chlorociboria aeruginascens]|nr:hypothetical protein B7494_g4120 [Chlorociboria aeruginascens]